MLSKINSVQIKPLNVILFVLIASFLILLLVYHFTLPNYYNASRDVIWQYIVEHPGICDSEVLKIFGNKYYWFHNGLFHVLTISFELLIFYLTINNVKTKTFFEKHRGIKIALIYCFLNVAYLMWMGLNVVIIEAELKKYVYTSIADCIMIPIMGMYFLFFCITFIYYPIVNIFNFIIFNTNIANKFLLVLYKTIFAIVLLLVLLGLSALYSSKFIYLHFISIIYLFILHLSIKELEIKLARKQIA